MAAAKRAKKSQARERGGDPLRYYCVVFLLLIGVVVFLRFRLAAELEAYEAANDLADRVLLAQDLTEPAAGQPPQGFGALALVVENMVQGYIKAVGGAAEGESGISITFLKNMATEAGVACLPGPERTDPRRTKGYVEIHSEVTVDPTTLDNFYRFIWNIESRGRYRVFDVRWELADEKENAQPPFHHIKKSTFKVGYREPLTKEG